VPAGLRELVLGEEFRRGFVEGVTLGVRGFLPRGEEVFRLAPVRRLELTSRSPGAGFPPDRLPPQLRARQEAEWRVLPELMGSPHLKQVTALRMDLPLGSAEALATARSAHLRLTELSVRWAGAEPAAVRELLASATCAGLRRLDVDGNQENQAIQALADVRLPHLRTLRLWARPLVHSDLLPLSTDAHLPALEELALRSLGPGDSHFTGLSPLLRRVKALDVSGGNAGDQGIMELVEEMPTGRLMRLALSYNQLHARGLQALAGCPGLSDLRELDLRGNVSTDPGLIALAESPSLHRLAALYLHFNGIGDRGVRALAASPVARNLAWLDLNTNRITSDGALALAESPHLKQLYRLELMRNDIGPHAQAALRERFGMAVHL
jgi:hypothetical protein